MANIERFRVVNPYAQLGLKPGAPLAEVKRAYRRLAMDLHPDRAGTGDLETFLAVKAAYESIVAHPSVARRRSTVEPGDRRPATVRRATGAPRSRRAAATGSRPAATSAPRGSWPGGRWYWEGRHDPGSNR